MTSTHICGFPHLRSKLGLVIGKASTMMRTTVPSRWVVPSIYSVGRLCISYTIIDVPTHMYLTYLPIHLRYISYPPHIQILVKYLAALSFVHFIIVV
ncbi:hypothetical protein F4815DRAFT_242219 [Daldinia loculata]|nr:hypothetical protein F4815DRAFT_242219 [Daldinia loculata]